MWLRGYDSNGNPLTVSQMMQDIDATKRKTAITIEHHPHVKVVCIGIHPCRHSTVMKKYAHNITINEYMFLFLKFLNSAIPTIEYDWTGSVFLGGSSYSSINLSNTWINIINNNNSTTIQNKKPLEPLINSEDKANGLDNNVTNVSGPENIDSEINIDLNCENKKYTIKKALVLMICISKYDKNSEFKCLKGVINDMKQLKYLWNDVFGYTIEYNNVDKPLSRNQFQNELDKARILLNSSVDEKDNNDSFDAFIFVFSGHGTKNSIVTSEGKKFAIKDIKLHFSPKNVESFKDKPKLFIIDACRNNGGTNFPCYDKQLNGDMVDSRLQMVSRSKNDGTNTTGVQRKTVFYHPMINTIEIYANSLGYGVGASKNGGTLVMPLVKYLIKCVKANIIKNKSLEQLLNPLKHHIHKQNGGNQIMSVVNEMVGMDVYLEIAS